MTKRKIVELEAAQADGTPINASHRVVEEELEGISPTTDTAHTQLLFKSGRVALAQLSAHEVAKKLGWDQG